MEVKSITIENYWDSDSSNGVSRIAEVSLVLINRSFVESELLRISGIFVYEVDADQDFCIKTHSTIYIMDKLLERTITWLINHCVDDYKMRYSESPFKPQTYSINRALSNIAIQKAYEKLEQENSSG